LEFSLRRRGSSFTMARTDSIDGMLRRNLGYVPALARRYVGLGLDLQELIAAGNLGLVEAALRFDGSRKVKFITYAAWWIRKAILESIEQLNGPVRLPRYRYEKLRWIKHERSRLIGCRGAEPTLPELAAATGLSVEETRRLLRDEPVGISLDQPQGRNDDRPLGEAIPDRGSDSPQTSLVRRDLAHRLWERMATLSAREQQVLRLRFGFDGERTRTLRETAGLLGISRERVRQIELRALLKIRRCF